MKKTHGEQQMFWNGHLVEGDRIVSHDHSTFVLWTRCGKHDVPANKAYVGGSGQKNISCAECKKFYAEEGGEDT